MLLLLIRHAQAVERNPAALPDDTLRELTPKGKKIHEQMSRALRKHDLVPNAILASPWKRAWQTALILAKGAGGDVVACPELAASPDLKGLGEAVGPRSADEIVAMVGHEPWLGELASELLAGEPKRLAIDFPKSGVLGLDLPEIGAGRAALRFFLRPKLIE